MQVTFVSALYKLQHDSLVGGRSYPLAWYFPSLRSIGQTKAALVLYVWPQHVEEITEFCAQHFETFQVIDRDLAGFPFHERIQELRIQKEYHLAANRDRCHTLCLNKFYWLREQALLNQFRSEAFFWIDAGLAHEGLFPAKYLPRTEFRTATCSLFNSALPRNLAKSTDRFLFLAQHTGGELCMMHEVAIPAMKNCLANRATCLDKHMIGGLFGGKATAIAQVYTQYEALLTEMLERELLGTEENVLTLLYFQNPAYFTLKGFETWHHEDSPTGLFKPQTLPFYQVFEAISKVLSPAFPAIANDSPA
jgi:hypothetical protein